MIGNASQDNDQGINSVQGAKKGHQNSTNLAVSAELIAPQDGGAIIGTTNQANDQGVELEPATGRAPRAAACSSPRRRAASSNQNSFNAVISAQVILG